MSCYINSGKRGCSRAVRRFVASPRVLRCRDHFGEVLVSHGLPANKLLGPIIQALPASEWVGPGISVDASPLVGLVFASRNGWVLSQNSQPKCASNGDEGFSDNMTTMPLAEVPYLTRARHPTPRIASGLAPQKGTSTLSHALPPHI